jgi:UDP-N-acetylmuramyl pentapeptide synthase
MAIAVWVGIMPAIALILVLSYGDKRKTTVTNVLTIVRPTFAIIQNLHPMHNLFHSEALKNVLVAHKEFHQLQ